MASLPEGWEADYDGARWFYKYKPTGIIQYHFPKLGDEFPEYFDFSGPVPDLAPEERLESDRQLKRRSTTDGKSPGSGAARKTRNNGASATIGGPDDGGWGNTFESFGYLGPGGYDNISPLNEEDEDEGRGARQNGEGSNKGVGSPAAASAALTPLTSAGTTPNVANSVAAASGTPPVAPPAVPAEPPDPTAGIPMLHSESLPFELPDAPNMGSTNSHFLAQTPQATNPLGFMAELATSDTPLAPEETAPIELPTMDSLYGVALPVELPHEPVEPKPAAPVVGSVTTPVVDVVRPPLMHLQTAPAAPPSAEQAVAQTEAAPSGQYKPFRAPGVEDNRRSSMVAGDLSKLRAQHPAGIVPGGQDFPPPRADSMSPQPLLVRKATAQPDASASGQTSGPGLQHVPSVLKPATNPAAGGRQALAHVPSVLKPARGREQSLSSTDPRLPSQFRPQPKSYMSGSGNTHISPERGVPIRQAAEPPGPGMLQRVNTLPDQLPSQAMIFFPEQKAQMSQMGGGSSAAAIPAVAELAQPHRPHSISHASALTQPPPIIQTELPESSMPAELTPTAVRKPAETQGQPTSSEQSQHDAASDVIPSTEDQSSGVYDEVLAMVQPSSHSESSAAAGGQVAGDSRSVSVDDSIPLTPPLFSRPGPSPSPFSQDSTATAPVQTEQSIRSDSVPAAREVHSESPAPGPGSISLVSSIRSDSIPAAREVHSESPAPGPGSISLVSSPSESGQQSISSAQTTAPVRAVSEDSQQYHHRGFSGMAPSKPVSYSTFSIEDTPAYNTAPSHQPTPPPVPKKIPESPAEQTPPSSFSTTAIASLPVATPPTPQPQTQPNNAASPPQAPKPMPQASVYVVSRPSSTGVASGAMVPPPARPVSSSPHPPAGPSQKVPTGANIVPQHGASPPPQQVGVANPPRVQRNVIQQPWQGQTGHIPPQQINHRQYGPPQPGYGQQGVPQGISQPGFPTQTPGPAGYPAPVPGQQHAVHPPASFQAHLHLQAAYQTGPAPGMNTSPPMAQPQPPQASQAPPAQPISSVHRTSLPGPHPNMTSTPPPAQQGLHTPSVSGSPAAGPPGTTSAPQSIHPTYSVSNVAPVTPPVAGPVAQVQNMHIDSRASSPAPSLREAVAQPIKRQSAGSIVPIQIKRQSQDQPQAQSQGQSQSQDTTAPAQPQFQGAQPGNPQNTMQHNHPPQMHENVLHGQRAQASAPSPQPQVQGAPAGRPQHTMQVTQPPHVNENVLAGQQALQKALEQARQQAQQLSDQLAPQQGLMPSKPQHAQSMPRQRLDQVPQQHGQPITQQAEQKVLQQPGTHPSQQRPGPGPAGPLQGTSVSGPAQPPAQGSVSGPPQQNVILPSQQLTQRPHAQHPSQQQYPQQHPQQPPQQQRQGSFPSQAPPVPQQVGPAAMVQNQHQMAQHQRQGSMSSQASSSSQPHGQVPPVAGPHHMPPVAQGQVPPQQLPVQGIMPSKPQHAQSMPVQGQIKPHGVQNQTPGNLHLMASQGQQPMPQQRPPQGHQMYHAQTAPLPSQSSPQADQQPFPNPALQQPPQNVTQNPGNASGSNAPGHQRKASVPLQPGTNVPQVQNQGHVPPAQTQLQRPPGSMPGPQGGMMAPPGVNPGQPPQMQQMPQQTGPGPAQPQTIYMIPQPGMPPQPIMMGQPLPPGVFMQYPQQPGMPVMMYRPPQAGPPQAGLPQPQIVTRPGMPPMQYSQPQMAPGQMPTNNGPRPQAPGAAGPGTPSSPTAVKKQGMFSKFFGGKDNTQQSAQGSKLSKTQGRPGQGPPPGGPVGLNMQMQVRPPGQQQFPSQQQQPNPPRVQQAQVPQNAPGIAPPANVQGQQNWSAQQQAPQNPGMAPVNTTAGNPQPGAGQNIQAQPTGPVARGGPDQSQRSSISHAQAAPLPQPQVQPTAPQGVSYAQIPSQSQPQSSYLQPGGPTRDVDNVSLLEPDEPEQPETKKSDVPVQAGVTAAPAGGNVAGTAGVGNRGWGNSVNYDGDDWGDDSYQY